jgi:hypothetical protein
MDFKEADQVVAFLLFSKEILFGHQYRQKPNEVLRIFVDRKGLSKTRWNFHRP